jgi:hypothetical protein
LAEVEEKILVANILCQHLIEDSKTPWQDEDGNDLAIYKAHAHLFLSYSISPRDHQFQAEEALRAYQQLSRKVKGLHGGLPVWCTSCERDFLDATVKLAEKVSSRITLHHTGC